MTGREHGQEPRRCIGYGERDNRRADPSKHCANVADKSPYLWCDECEAERRRSLSNDFARITNLFTEGKSGRGG